MNIITRYVSNELLKVFAIALTVMSFMMILAGLVQEAIQQGLGPLAIAQLVPYVLPNALRFAVPGTLLFAASSVYGRMSAHNELVAIKALGVSPWVVVWPGLVVAFVISLFTVWLNDVAVSWGRRGMQRVVIESVEQIAYGKLRTQKSYSTRRFSISVKRVVGRTLIRPTMVLQGSGSSPTITLTAQKAEIRRDAEKDTLVIVLNHGEMSAGDDVKLFFADNFEYEIPLSDASRKGDVGRRPSDCPLRQIPEKIIEQRQVIDRLEQSLAARAAFNMLTASFDDLTDQQWENDKKELQLARAKLHRLYTEPWRRWANGFSCFFFVLVGAPLAIRMRNEDLWTSFGLCFLPILLIYYPLLMIGVGQAKSGALPPYSVWLGNIILLGIGYWMIRRINRN